MLSDAMPEAVPASGKSLPRSMVEAGATTLDRLSSFRVTYVAIFAFLVLAVTSIEGAEQLLSGHFSASLQEAIGVSPAHGPVVPQIQDRVSRAIQDSPWVRIGRIRVNAFVLGADGRTPLYMGVRTIPPPPNPNPESWIAEAIRLLPASADVVVSVPLNSVLAVGILVAYGAILVQGLFLYNRAVARREEERLVAAISARDATAERAGAIQGELEQVRGRLREVEPSERAHADEIQQLEKEREALRRKLGDLAEREAELRASASRATELEDERQTLEDLLEEAVEDLGHKEGEIQSLQDRLKRASRSAPSGGRGRASEQLSRRMRTLYKHLEIDDRAIQDMVALRDETMKLKAEEGIKRLVEDPESAAIRRKVGGLPPQLSIFEMGFAGKGRIYYTRGKQTRYRVLAIGAKNTQKTDIEYLSRLTPD
jgi:predicted  nucleic acid-binding Zn-ribbon protein